MSRRAPQHRLARVVGEAHVAVLHVPALAGVDGGQVRRTGTALHVGVLVEHLHEAAEAGVALLQRLGEVDELLHRRDEDADVERVDGQVGDGQGALGHEEPAAHDGHRVQHAHEQGVHGVEGTEEPVGALLRVEERLVGAAELLALGRLAAEGLHHANAAEGILHRGVDAGHALPVLAEHRASPVVQREGQSRHHQRGRQHNGRQRHVDHEQQGEGAHDLQRANEQVLRPVVRQLRYVEEVARDLRHHGPGVVPIVVGKRQPLKLGEQVAAHVRLHVGAHDVPPAGDEELAARAQSVQRHKQQQDKPQAAENALGRLQEELLREEVQKLREGQIDARQHHRAGQIGEEQSLVGPVVRNEPPPHPRRGHFGVGFAQYVIGCRHTPIIRLRTYCGQELFGNGTPAARNHDALGHIDNSGQKVIRTRQWHDHL